MENTRTRTRELPCGTLTITQELQTSHAGWIYFELHARERVALEALKTIQRDEGYHPHGYGFYNLIEEPLTPSGYLYKWRCSGSCD